MGKQLVTYTFKGTAPPGAAAAGGLLSTRAAFYGKTAGQVQHDTSSGLLKVASQVSGYTLTVPDGSGPNHHAAIKDPLTGTLLKLDKTACVVTPVLRQPQVHSRSFFLKQDIDVSIATQRATNTLGSDKTNEKLGTSGTATGLDGALVAGGSLRCQEKRQTLSHE